MADSIPIPVCSTRNRFYLSTRIDATDVLTRSSTLDRFSYGSVTPYSKGYSSPSSPKPPSSLYALSSSVLSSFNRYTGSFIACRTSDLIISFCPHRFIPQADCLVPVVTEILCHGSPQLIKISHLSIRYYQFVSCYPSWVSRYAGFTHIRQPLCLLHGLLHPFTFLYLSVPPEPLPYIIRPQVRVFSLIHS